LSEDRMPYHQITEWLFSLQAEGIKFGLENTLELLHRVGDPHLAFRSLHVAGTNGKGSTCAMLAAVLKESGIRTGLYTSPHILDFIERIKVQGEDIRPQTVEELAHELRPVVQEMEREGRRLTFFEVTTVMAFLHFKRSKVEMAVVETGMGGRLDSTNVLLPDLSIITPIGMEHSSYLGRTINEIAFEKAGIVKSKVPVVTNNVGEALKVIRNRCTELDSPLNPIISSEYFRVKQERGPAIVEKDGQEYRLGLRGVFQIENAAVVLEALKVLNHPKISYESISRGLSTVSWPARLELISQSPDIYLDSTHNGPGSLSLAKEMPFLGKDITMVFGILQDKDVDFMCRTLGPMAERVVVTEAHTDRAMAADRVAKVMGNYNDDVTVEECPGDAIIKALDMAGKDGTVLITGSIYLAGDALKWLKQRR